MILIKQVMKQANLIFMSLMIVRIKLGKIKQYLMKLTIPFKNYYHLNKS